MASTALPDTKVWREAVVISEAGSRSVSPDSTTTRE